MDLVVSGTGGRWVARRDGAVVGELVARVRPDGRCFLFPGDGPPAAFGALLDAALGELGDRDVHLEAAPTDELAARGFVVHRREHLYRLPIGAERPVTPPAGYAFVSAADADLDRLRVLDERLRGHVPGVSGWRNEPAAFARETFQDPEFEASTYPVAVCAATGDYAGLARVWVRRDGRPPRLGLVGVRPAHRRRGLARALLARAFAPLRARGVGEVVTEVDETNTASRALMAGFGARRTGTAVELRRAGRTGEAGATG
ncbi:GNAT family N-acetyltransferase [Streptomyces sp. DSM 44915]|uniref:GNAT family N-acetyltransferase n=1 Tax=Streptomyces chisholmiae TaxID=3075540 RepID=A0ABU2JLX6_9ACTN|nr:GNAT family N-acetyltransferase [Streptomyces sp. DSM 44915]MDT0265977.1 GNAT family N-acetyltransferase [Streptomyces sp. DSM 44915]